MACGLGRTGRLRRSARVTRLRRRAACPRGTTMSRSAPAPRFGTFLLVGPPLGLFPSHRTAGSHVPHRSLNRTRAAFVPVTARAVDRCPPSFIPDQQLEPGFDDVPTLSTRCQRFTFIRLPDSHLTGLSPPFPETLTTPVIGPTQLSVVWTPVLQPESEGPTLIFYAAKLLSVDHSVSLPRLRGAQSSAYRTKA